MRSLHFSGLSTGGVPRLVGTYEDGRVLSALLDGSESEMAAYLIRVAFAEHHDSGDEDVQR